MPVHFMHSIIASTINFRFYGLKKYVNFVQEIYSVLSASEVPLEYTRRMRAIGIGNKNGSGTNIHFF